MSLGIEQFEDFFRALWNHDPFPWQLRLTKKVFEDGWPDCIDLPTASGKTACIDIAVYVLACQAARRTHDRTVGRRIFFTVNRRVIVDEAFDRSLSLAKRLVNSEDGILKEVSEALLEVGADDEAPPLDVAQLRGGIYCDRAWVRSITQPTIVCTTVDQLGSRLLFRGYGVSSSMQPIHAALTACDSLVLLDEAHVTRAFSQTLSLLNRYRRQETTTPPMRFVQMTATPSGSVAATFTLDTKDHENPILSARQSAPKPADLVKTKSKSIASDVVDRAVKCLSPERKAIGIIVNRVQTARDTEVGIRAALSKEHIDADVHLLIGRMRPLDRDVLQGQLRGIIGPGRPGTLEKPVFVVATQCLEVGADYDFDALITECASIDALRQRFGRLNRNGRPIDTTAAILTTEASLKDEDPVYGEALRKTWAWLTGGGRETIDFGITAFAALWESVDATTRQEMLSPALDAAVLLPAHLDALCQTSPYPLPSPDVSFFIHGPQRTNAEVNVCWRADLGDTEALWPQIVGLLPPTSPECMTVPLHTVASWMRNQPAKNDADVPAQLNDDQFKGTAEHIVLIWRGADDSVLTKNPGELRPGDTVIIPAQSVASRSIGHIPGIAEYGPIPDVAEQAYQEVRRQRVVRVHPSVHPELPQELLDYAMSAEAILPKAQIRELIGPLVGGFTSGPDEIAYPRSDGGPPPGLLLRFNKLLPNVTVFSTSRADDDGRDSSTESTHPVPLSTHSHNVAECVARTVDRLHLNSYALLFERAADLHDSGKADIRFQAMLSGLTPYEAMERPSLLAKSGRRGLTPIERQRQRDRAELPKEFRHEMLSVELIVNGFFRIDDGVDHELLLHLIAAHHGYGRPFAPVVFDDVVDETLSIDLNGVSVTPEQRNAWIPSHRLDSGVAERFWRLTRKHGWWGVAWLESILRLSDQQASAAEEEEGGVQ